MEAAIRAALASGKGMLKVARKVGIGRPLGDVLAPMEARAAEATTRFATPNRAIAASAIPSNWCPPKIQKVRRITDTIS